ncbi:hypothetical protein [Streptomyces sp. NPDC006879]|uniref:hypothetical protein n=1 Tax=Streptomyces sp. NPDC006879 TaxID=3364767 RepID=UPI0036A06E2B
MSTAPSGWSLRALAQEAHVLPKVARDAAEEGVIDAQHTVETDIVLVRLYGALKRLVWPEERRPANKDQGLRVWEAITIETARAALPDDMHDDTGLFVHQTGCELVSGPGPKALAFFKLAEHPFYYAPLGRWFNELPTQRLRVGEVSEKAQE